MLIASASGAGLPPLSRYLTASALIGVLAAVCGGVAIFAIWFTASGAPTPPPQLKATQECFAFDPRSGNQDPSLGGRPCVPGKLAYIKWHDPGPYGPSSGPQDRPNRLVQIVSRDPQGFFEWDEYELVRLVDGEERWHTHGQNWVTLMDSYAACGERGLLLRRIDLNPIPIGDGKTQCDLPGHTRSVKEWLFPTDAGRRIERGDHVFICTRDIEVPCDKEFRFELISHGTPFEKSNREIVNVRSDP